MYDLVIVGMFKNESMILKEWLDHHIDVGVQHFYLIDNGSTDDYIAVLAPYRDNGTVTLVVDPSRYTKEESLAEVAPSYDHAEKRIIYAKNTYRHTQDLLANRHYLGLVKTQAVWVMYLDQDEYMFSTRGTLTDVLGTVGGTCTNIWVPWRMFGSGGREKQPSSVRKGFLHMRSSREQKAVVLAHGNITGHGKSVCKVSALTGLRIHRSLCYPDVGLGADGRGAVNRAWMESYEGDRHQDLLFCNHYAVMSKEYFTKYKSQRKSGAGGRAHGIAYFRKHDEGCNRLDTLIASAGGISEGLITQNDINAANRCMLRHGPAPGTEREILQNTIMPDDGTRP